MKSYNQFFEDIESRRQELRQRQLDQATKFKQRAKEYSASQQHRREEGQERERLKSEIKRELKNEK